MRLRVWTATAKSCVWCGVVRWGRRSRRPATANKSDVRRARRKADARLCLFDSPGKRGSSQGTAARVPGDTRKTTARDKTRKRGKNRHTQNNGQRKLGGAREGGQDAEKRKSLGDRGGNDRRSTAQPASRTHAEAIAQGRGGVADPGAHTQTRPANTPRHTPDTPRQHTRHTPATHPDTPATRPDTPDTHPTHASTQPRPRHTPTAAGAGRG